MSSPPLPLDDISRLSALARSGLMDSQAELSFDRVSRLASQVLNAPVALLSLVDERRQFFKSSIGLTGQAASDRQTPLSHSFCQHVVTSGAPLVVDDALQHPLVRTNQAINDLNVMDAPGPDYERPSLPYPCAAWIRLQHGPRKGTRRAIRHGLPTRAEVTLLSRGAYKYHLVVSPDFARS